MFIMHRLVLFILLQFYMVPSFGQYLKEDEKEFYLRKNKRQSTTGNVLVLSGATMIIVGAIIAGTSSSGESSSDSSNGWSANIDVPNIPPPEAVILILGGITTGLISIPFYVSASINKKKAMKITLQPDINLSKIHWSTKAHCNLGLSLKIRL